MSVPDAPVDWGSLGHAYAAAVDTPLHLADLVGADEDARDRAMGHLWGAVLHQGTIYPATAPAAEAVARLLGDPRLGRRRARLLDFLAEVGAGCRYDPAAAAREPSPGVARAAAAMERGDWSVDLPDDVQEAALAVVFERAIAACRRIAPRLLGAVTAFLDDADPAVRVSAANAAAKLAPSADPAERPALVRRLGAACERAGARERAALALSLGDLGDAPRRLLADPEPMVSACAALAPALAGDPTATSIIVDALAQPDAVDEWLSPRTPQVQGWLRFLFVRAAVQRVGDFDRLLPGALAIARAASRHSVDRDWGPLLGAAFSRPAESGSPLSSAQRAFLRGLVANADLWDPRFGNPAGWFAAAGLPYDRDACRAIAG